MVYQTSVVQNSGHREHHNKHCKRCIIPDEETLVTELNDMSWPRFVKKENIFFKLLLCKATCK